MALDRSNFIDSDWSKVFFLTIIGSSNEKIVTLINIVTSGHYPMNGAPSTGNRQADYWGFLPDPLRNRLRQTLLREIRSEIGSSKLYLE